MPGADPQTVSPHSTDRASDERAWFEALRRVLPADGLLTDPVALRPYECDGLSAYRQTPRAVALPRPLAPPVTMAEHPSICMGVLPFGVDAPQRRISMRVALAVPPPSHMVCSP